MRACSFVRSGAIALVAVTAIALTACSSTEQRALAPTQDAAAAIATSQLAWQQFERDSTLSPTTVTTLEDMLAALAEAEGTLTELPTRQTVAAASALEAVRASADVVSRTLDAANAGTDDPALEGSLQRSATQLDAAVGLLEAEK